MDTYSVKKLFKDGSTEVSEELIIKETPIKIYEKGEVVYETTAYPEKIRDLEEGFKFVHYYRKIRDFERTPNTYEKEDISNIIDGLSKTLSKSDLYKVGRCTHCMALCSKDGPVFFGEDISRHNALYKVIGDCFLHKRYPWQYYLCASSRMTYSMLEIIQKAGIDCVVTKSAVTDSAILMARDFGIRMYGCATEDMVKQYTD